MDVMKVLRLTLAFAAIAAAGIAVGCDDGDDGGDATATRPAVQTAPAQVTSTPLVAPTANPAATPGPAARIDVSAEPQRMACDGATVSAVRAVVVDAAGQPVEDGTAVRFDVRVYGSVDPVNAQTSGGVAETSLTAVGEGVGVVVNVTSGDAAGAVRVDCE